jgi:hypothetical protein
MYVQSQLQCGDWEVQRSEGHGGRVAALSCKARTQVRCHHNALHLMVLPDMWMSIRCLSGFAWKSWPKLCIMRRWLWGFMFHQFLKWVLYPNKFFEPLPDITLVQMSDSNSHCPGMWKESVCHSFLSILWNLFPVLSEVRLYKSYECGRNWLSGTLSHLSVPRHSKWECVCGIAELVGTS